MTDQVNSQSGEAVMDHSAANVESRLLNELGTQLSQTSPSFEGMTLSLTRLDRFDASHMDLPMRPFSQLFPCEKELLNAVSSSFCTQLSSQHYHANDGELLVISPSQEVAVQTSDILIDHPHEKAKATGELQRCEAIESSQVHGAVSGMITDLQDEGSALDDDNKDETSESLLQQFDIQVDEQASTSSSGYTQPLLKNRYRLEKILGVGGMGVVWKARDMFRFSLGDPDPVVAIKLPSAEMADYQDVTTLLYNEYRISERLNHPHIITVQGFDYCSDSDQPFILMRYLKGRTLDELLQDGKLSPMPALKARAWCSQLLDAVHYSHSCHVVHADLKFSNLMINEQDRLVLFDFGIGRLLHGDAGLSLNWEQFKAWSSRFAAPELFAGETPNYVSDYYSLCCLIYWLLGGHHPYGVRADEAKAQKLKYRPLFGRRDPLDRRLRSGLNFEPSQRSLDLLQLKLDLYAHPCLNCKEARLW